MPKLSFARWVVLVSALLFMAALYLFQRQSLLMTLMSSGTIIHPYVTFVVNKTLRMVLNDAACMAIIWAVFQERTYLKLAWYVFLIEVLILLPLYFVIKLSIEGDSEISSPLLSQLHRMIVNPTLMLLLIIGFFYQRSRA